MTCCPIGNTGTMWQHRGIGTLLHFAFILRFAVSVSPLHGMRLSDQQVRCAVQFRSIHKFQEEQNMNQNEQKPCCVNCHISGVPLYLGLDGKQHCADHIGLLLPDSPKQETKPVGKDVIL